MDVNETCMICQSLPESAFHCFVECKFARDCWNYAGFCFDENERNFSRWFAKLLNALTSDGCDRVLSIF